MKPERKKPGPKPKVVMFEKPAARVAKADTSEKTAKRLATMAAGGAAEQVKAALANGPLAWSDLITKTGLSKSAVYGALDKLTANGTIARVEGGSAYRLAS